MLGVMRGAVDVAAVLGRVRRQVHFGIVDTDDTLDEQIITPLDVFLSKHRSCKSHIPFSSLDVSCRKDFYDMAANYYIENEGGVTTYLFMPSKSNHTYDKSD